MPLGQTIRAPLSSSAMYYSPWFPRQGTHAVFACNLIAAAEVSSFTITVQTKRAEDDNPNANIEEVGSAATIGTGSEDAVVAFERGNSISGGDTTAGVRDLVRFQYTISSNSSKKGWVHFRMLDPTWETD